MTEKAIFSHNNAMAQTTQASVGNGTITIGGQTLDKGNASELGLAMLNRDLAQAQRLTQDEAIGGLNFTTTIDGRWFSPEGRHEMADDQKKAGGALLGLGAKGLMAGGAAIGALTGAFKEDKALDGAVNVVKAVNAAEAYATKDAEGAATIDAYRDGQYSDLTNSQNATQKLAETMGADEDIRFTNVLTGMGVAGTTDGVNIYLDINGATRSDTVATLGHDVGHNLGIEKEWLAGVMGMATSMAFTAGLWQNADAVAAFRPVNTITADTLKANARLLATNNADFIEAFTDHPDEFENSLFVKDAPLYRAASKCLTQGCNPFTELGHQYKLDAQQNQLIAQLTAANLKQAGVEMVSGITAIPGTIQYIKEHPEVLKELPANLAADFKAALQQYGDDLAAIGAGPIVSDPASLEAQAQAEARLAAQLIQVVAGAGAGFVGGKIAIKTGARITAAVEDVAATRKLAEFEREATESARINNNIYADGSAMEFPRELKTSSGIVMRANPDKTTTVLGEFRADTGSIINQQLGQPKSMVIDGPTQPGSFNLLNTPDDLYTALGPDKFWGRLISHSPTLLLGVATILFSQLGQQKMLLIGCYLIDLLREAALVESTIIFYRGAIDTTLPLERW